MASPDIIKVLIVNYHAAIGGGKTAVPPCVRPWIVDTDVVWLQNCDATAARLPCDCHSTHAEVKPCGGLVVVAPQLSPQRYAAAGVR